MSSDAVTVALFLVEKALSFLEEELSRDERVLIGVKRIKGHLIKMQAYLQDADGREGSSQMMGVLVGDIQDLAHEMEDVLDDFMIHAPRVFSTSPFLQRGYEACHHLKHRAPVQEIQSKIARIDERMSKITDLPELQELVHIVHTNQPLPSPSPGEPQMWQYDEIVGIDSHKEDLINLLLNKSSSARRCKTISVVGPSGAGKTVLVNCVFTSEGVVRQFDCLAWLSLYRSDNHEQRLQRLFSILRTSGDELHFPLEGDTAMKLKKYLEHKRFILVLDGVRDDEEWASIRRVLPDYCNHSWMIITTQNGDVATRCSAPDNHILRVNGLGWNESWMLFCKKANFQNGKCPPELRDLSEIIVKRCEGLPQPISAVGTLLSTKPQVPEEWRRVHANMGSEMQRMPSNCANTMFLPSYYDLSSNQKSCLLYLSLFPEDYSIKRERLIRLWLSEGFIGKSGNIPLEKIAKDILNDLISRNLVDASSRDFIGRAKSCRVLNLMREFITQKSKEKKFAAVVTNRDLHLHPRDRTIPRRLSIENASSSLRKIGGLPMDGVRSLFMFGLDRASPEMIVTTLQRIRLLKVLDLENAPLNSFPECILDAALLRYLSLRNTNVDMVPKDIKKLRYLEYLDLKQTQVTSLPKEIFLLQYLQHLLVYRCNPEIYETFNRLQGVQIDGEMTVWPYIQKLSIIKVNHNKRFFVMLGQLTLLKKLGLTNLREGDMICSCIENMPDLSTLDLTSSNKEEKLDLQHINSYPKFLQHLYLKGRLVSVPTWIPSLNELSRLLLRGSKLNDSPTEKLQHLPNLMELEMTDAFTGEILIIERGGFPKLRTLHIEQFGGLNTIAVSNGGMPMLQKLTIVRCMHLYDLLSGINELKKLQEFMLYDMPQHLIDMLDKNSAERWMISHVPIIRSFYARADNTWGFRNFS